MLPASPLDRIVPPIARADQIQPFSDEQVDALLEAARRSQNPRRNTALLLFLLDTGARATEVCSIRYDDLDLPSRTCLVLGKGNKRRPVFFGIKTAKAIAKYRLGLAVEPDAPLFRSDNRGDAGKALTRSGLLQLVERLGKDAGIKGVRCSPHTFRHTMACTFIRAGGSSFALQHLLGHTNSQQTARYVALASADCQEQHRRFCPSDRLHRVSR